MAYATPTELAAYVGETVTLPSAAEQTRLLERASELIDEVTLNRINVAVVDHAEAARSATMAQVESWLRNMVGEADDVTARGVASYSIGSMSVDYGRAGGSAGGPVASSALAPRARRYLFLAGLLYRGVGRW